jgi:renalase
MPPPRIAIIGAGLTGIAAARHLRALGLAPTLYEKSRGYGGRCATKRWQDCRIDHGAQYFTLRDPAFSEAVQAHCGDQVLTLTAPILDASSAPLPSADRYYHRHGNSRLVRDLAADLDVRLETPVSPLHQHGDRWSLNEETYDHVLSTAPLPQTLQLFHQPLTVDPFIPCLALLLRYAGDAPGLTAQRYAVSAPDAPVLAWSACENHKQGRIPAGSTCLVAHASEAFSRRHLEDPPEVWAPLLQAEVERLWELTSCPLLAQHPHRWRYARVASAIPCPALPPGLHHASDALIKSRVESAWLAGHAAAAALAAQL